MISYVNLYIGKIDELYYQIIERKATTCMHGFERKGHLYFLNHNSLFMNRYNSFDAYSHIILFEKFDGVLIKVVHT